jgi:O-methyltransferase
MSVTANKTNEPEAAPLEAFWHRVAKRPGYYLKRLPSWGLLKCSPLFRQTACRLQAAMDIDPAGWSYRPEFASAVGGFFLPDDPVVRHIAPFEPWDLVRRDALILLLRSAMKRNVPGDLAELGVYQGVTARLFHEYCPDRTLLLFDTFTGFDTRDTTSREGRLGMFADTSAAVVFRYIAAGGVDMANVLVREGYFPESVASADSDRRFAFVHLDADLYGPTRAGLEFFYPRLNPGGIIVVHDYNSWEGARRAVDEFSACIPDIPLPLPDKSGSVLIVRGSSA